MTHTKGITMKWESRFANRSHVAIDAPLGIHVQLVFNGKGWVVNVHNQQMITDLTWDEVVKAKQLAEERLRFLIQETARMF